MSKQDLNDRLNRRQRRLGEGTTDPEILAQDAKILARNYGLPFRELTDEKLVSWMNDILELGKEHNNATDYISGDWEPTEDQVLGYNTWNTNNDKNCENRLEYLVSMCLNLDKFVRDVDQRVMELQGISIFKMHLNNQMLNTKIENLEKELKSIKQTIDTKKDKKEYALGGKRRFTRKYTK